MPKVSIIVPVYKVEPYLRKCVDSILSQSFSDFELILVDDGSTDNCGLICDEYKEKDSRVRVLHQKNAGLSEARNKGIELAKGTYVMFIDSDDYIEERLVECLYQKIEENSADIAICSVYCVPENRNVNMSGFKNDYNPIKSMAYTGREILSVKMFERESWIWVIACNKLYKRELFSKLRFPKGKIHEDEFMIHKIMLMCDKVIGVPEVSYIYLIREGSITGRKINIKRLDYVECLFDRVKCYAEERGFEHIAKKMLEDGVREFRKYYYNVGKKSDKAHKNRNRELQKLYREAFRTLKRKKIKLDRYYYVNYFSMYYTWVSYIARKKLIRIIKGK